MELILAVDPGKTTGLAMWHKGKVFVNEQPWDDFWLDTFEIFSGRTRLDKPDLVVCERFDINRGTTQKTQEGKISLETIGVMRFLCKIYAVEFELQGASDAMKFATNDKLKRVGWYEPGKEHGRDASRHLLVACVKRGLIKPSEVVS